MFFSITYPVTIGFAVVAALTSPVASERMPPHGGDLTTEQTAYDLTVYSKPGFRGIATSLDADTCVDLAKNNVEVGSLKFTGNNCCFIFPENNCRNPLGGQRVVGNVRDVNAWGFPQLGAVKCLSHTACNIIGDGKCALNPHCADEQADPAMKKKCPFGPDCKAYHPVHASDLAEPLGGNPRDDGKRVILERYQIDAEGHRTGDVVSGKGTGAGANNGTAPAKNEAAPPADVVAAPSTTGNGATAAVPTTTSAPTSTSTSSIAPGKTHDHMDYEEKGYDEVPDRTPESKDGRNLGHLSQPINSGEDGGPDISGRPIAPKPAYARHKDARAARRKMKAYEKNKKKEAKRKDLEAKKKFMSEHAERKKAAADAAAKAAEKASKPDTEDEDDE